MPKQSNFAKRLVRRVVLAAILATVIAVPAAAPPAAWLHRLGLDLLLPLQRALWPVPIREAAVAVVAIDEATYAAPAFAGRPQVAWTPLLGQVIEAIAGGGATAIGLDLIYPTTLDQPDLLPGYDRPLLRALLSTGRSGRLVMAMTRLSEQAIVPQQRQIMAVGGSTNLRPVNLLLDPDEVVRRAPLRFPAEDGAPIPSFAAELAARAGFAAEGDDILIDMRRPTETVPMFGLADIHARAEAGDTAFFERFRGKVVLIGTNLDVEDRFVTTARFAGAKGVALARGSTPGVLIHAQAIETIATGSAPRLVESGGAFAAVWGATFLLALLFLAVPPLPGAVALAGIGVAGILGAAALLAAADVVLPVISLAIGAGLAFTGSYAYRFVIEGRGKRRIEHAFRHYLAPALVERLAEHPDALRLGGETRRLTVFFSDMAGFTTISEGLSDRPDVLVALMNRYLSMMTDIVQAHGGYVDKFIGDAVMAIWGAPLPDSDGDGRAVTAALECLTALETFNRDVVAVEFGMPPLGTRIGINTGPAVVGNMGASSRLNYTVVGDTVNLAARLEGANKPYGSNLMIGEATAEAVRDRFVLRRLDLLVVKGKSRPVAVYEPLGCIDAVTPAVLARAEAYGAALSLYDTRRFAEAENAFAALAAEDATAALYVKRCRAFRDVPPPPDWDGSYTLKEK